MDGTDAGRRELNFMHSTHRKPLLIFSLMYGLV